jgi:hypothetical protein
VTIKRTALLAAVCATVGFLATALTGCTAARTEAARPVEARRTPAVVPTGTPTPTVTPQAPPVDAIDAETSEQLLLAGAARLAVDVNGRPSELALPQSTTLDMLIEQEPGERKRVLRLNTAGAASADADEFSVEGIMAVGTFKTGEAGLKLVVFSPSLGLDIFSDDGSCTITFAKADPAGADGSVSCPEVRGDGTLITITGTFTARPAAA